MRENHDPKQGRARGAAALVHNGPIRQCRHTQARTRAPLGRGGRPEAPKDAARGKKPPPLVDSWGARESTPRLPRPPVSGRRCLASDTIRHAIAYGPARARSARGRGPRAFVPLSRQSPPAARPTAAPLPPSPRLRPRPLTFAPCKKSTNRPVRARSASASMMRARKLGGKWPSAGLVSLKKKVKSLSTRPRVTSVPASSSQVHQLMGAS